MMRFLAHPIGRWLPTVSWMLVIFWFSSRSDLPRANGAVLEFLFKKSAHVLAYAVLAVCYVWGVGQWQRRWVALLLVVAYAASDEYHQSWTPGRHPAWTDVVIDTGGALLGLGALARLGPTLLQKQLKIGLVVPPNEAA